MMTRSRGTLEACGQRIRRKETALSAREAGSMIRKGFRTVRDLLMFLWSWVRHQPLTPSAALEDQLSGMPETQAQRLRRRWKRSRARRSE